MLLLKKKEIKDFGLIVLYNSIFLAFCITLFTKKNFIQDFLYVL